MNIIHPPGFEYYIMWTVKLDFHLAGSSPRILARAYTFHFVALMTFLGFHAPG